MYAACYIRLYILCGTKEEVSTTAIKEIGTNVTRLLLLSSLTILLTLLKMASIPEGTMVITPFSSGYSDTSKDGFYYSTWGIEQERIVDGKEQTVFCRDNVKVVHRKYTIYRFRNEGWLKDYNPGDFERYTGSWIRVPVRTGVTDHNIHIFSNKLIVWVDGFDEAHEYKIDMIKATNERPALTALFEKVITDGYLAFFDDICEYMVKNDPDFIESYLRRYARGIFTEEERKNFYKSI